MSESPPELEEPQPPASVEIGSVSGVSGGEVNIAGGDIRQVQADVYLEHVDQVVYFMGEKDEDEQDEPPAPGDPPFMGLQYFDVEDAGRFFGRELLVAQLIERLKQSNFLAVVVGASGSGKSSIIRAGLIAALQRGEPLAAPQGGEVLPPVGSSQWPIHLITPTANPLEALAASLTRDVESVTATSTLIDDLRREPRSLHLYARKLLSQQHASRLLLVVDQFEELFSLCRDETERKVFIDNLLTAVDPETRGPTLVVIALRADFYEYCGQYANLRQALAHHQEYIGPMSRDELRRAIEEPARLGGWEFEAGLVDVILREVGEEPGALPLLSHALLETWRRRRGHTMTLAGYTASGGVYGAIAKTAETVFQSFSADEQVLARRIFLRLVELEESIQDTRRRATLAELQPGTQQQAAVEAVLNRLVEARLVVTGEKTVEIAHEALIREWPTLRRWLDENREWLRLHRQIGGDAQTWLILGRDDGALYRGVRLAAADEWAAKHRAELSALEAEFLDASSALQQRELEQARSTAARLRRGVVGLTIGLAAAGVAILVAVGALFSAVNASRRNAELADQNSRIAATAQAASTQAVAQADLRATAQAQAEQEAQISLARQLAAQAANDTSTRYDLALLLSLEANRLHDSPEVRGSLFSGLMQNPNLVEFINGHSGSVNALAISPDGSRLASGGDDMHIILWDYASRQPLGEPLSGHTAKLLSLAFSPDGKTLASASADGSVRLWEVQSGRPLGEPLLAHKDAVNSVVFSPDGKLLASAGTDGSVILWDMETRREITRARSEENAKVYHVNFSPDGSLLAFCSADQLIYLWDIAKRQPFHAPLRGHADRVYRAIFSPDGSALVSGGDDNRVFFWDVESGEQMGAPLKLPGQVGSLVFSPDGKTLAVGSGSGIYLWDYATRRALGQPMLGQIDPVIDMVFSLDGAVLIANTYRALIVRRLEPQLRLGQVLAGHSADARVVAYAPDGSVLASGGYDSQIILWEPRSHNILARLENGGQPVFSLAFDPYAGSLFATRYQDIVQWDLAFFEPFEEAFSAHSDWARALALSPDGSLLVSVGYDGGLNFWDLRSHTLLHSASVGSDRQLYAVAFSPDGRLVAAGGDDQRITLWDAATFQPVGEPLIAHSDLLLSLAFSPDGRYLASGGADKKIFLWDMQTRQMSGEALIGQNNWVYGLAFSPDGRLLASGGGDNKIILWDVAARQMLGQPLNGHSDRVWSVTFSPDGKTLVSAGGDHQVILWNIDVQDWRQAACRIVRRSLTPQEWALYLPGIPYHQTCP